MKRFTKEDIGEILQRLLRQSSYNEMISEIQDIADEYHVDITEVEEEEDGPAELGDETYTDDLYSEDPYLEDAEDDWDADYTGELM